MIKKIIIKNFCSIKDMEIELGKLNIFSGQNGLGKTTIINAIYWLLADKRLSDVFGSENDNKGIIPLDDEKAVVSVSAELENGTIIKKEYYNKFTKQRGTNQISFDGRKTDYYVNNTPCKIAEYNETLEQLFNFKLKELNVSDKKFDYLSMLIDPFYLFSKVDAKTQRQVVTSIAGEITNEMVYKTNPIFEPLREIESKYLGDFDKARTDINSSLRKLDEKLKANEVSLSNCVDVDFNEEEYNKLQKEKEDLIQKSLNVKSNYSQLIKDKQDEIYSYQNKLIESEEKDRKNAKNSKVEELKQQLNDLEKSHIKNRQEKSICQNNLESSNLNIERYDAFIKQHTYMVDKLEKELVNYLNWKPIVTECSNCGFTLTSEEEIQKQKEDNEKRLNDVKSSISNHKDLIIKSQNVLEKSTKLKEELITKLKELKPVYEQEEKDINSLYERIKELQTQKVLIVDSEETKQLLNQIHALNEELSVLRNKEQEDIQIIKENIIVALNDLDERLELLIVAKHNKDNKSKLEKEIQELINSYNTNEKYSTLCDLFIKEKIKITNNLITNKLGINFVMLENQVNGGIKEVCYPTTENDVPYNDSNTAFKILCGAKIRKATAINCTLPIIIDRGESLDNLSKKIIKDYGFQTFMANVSNDIKIIHTREE